MLTRRTRHWRAVCSRSVRLNESFERCPGARSMMLRPVLRSSPAIFLSIDYERYEFLIETEGNSKHHPAGTRRPTDIVSSCACTSHAKPMARRAQWTSCAAVDAKQEASCVGKHAPRKRATIEGKTSRCANAGAVTHLGVLPAIRHGAHCLALYSTRYSTRYSLRRADGVPPISCVIFATHSSNAGAISLSSASRGA
jgi:hypothetical protein